MDYTYSNEVPFLKLAVLLKRKGGLKKEDAKGIASILTERGSNSFLLTDLELIAKAANIFLDDIAGKDLLADYRGLTYSLLDLYSTGEKNTFDKRVDILKSLYGLKDKNGQSIDYQRVFSDAALISQLELSDRFESVFSEFKDMDYATAISGIKISLKSNTYYDAFDKTKAFKILFQKNLPRVIEITAYNMDLFEQYKSLFNSKSHLDSFQRTFQPLIDARSYVLA